MKDARTRTKLQTLSVGETAQRLNVSPDTVRNYCERGLLEFIRKGGNHRRVLIRSIESFETQRNPKKPDSVATPQALQQKPRIKDEFEVYYLGNEENPNDIARGYICNFSFFESMLPAGFSPSTIMRDLGSLFGGGNFKILRVRDGEVISERTFSLPGPTKDEVRVMREVSMDN